MTTRLALLTAVAFAGLILQVWTVALILGAPNPPICWTAPPRD